MAIIRPSAIVAGISGSIGGVTFANSKTGIVARHRPYRKPNHAPKLLQQQGYFARVTRHWREISDLDRRAWRSLAVDYPITNRLGQASARTGYGLFTAANLNLFRSKGTLWDAPPTQRNISITITAAITFDDAPDYDILLDLAGAGPSTYVQVWGSRHLSYIDPRSPPEFRILFENSLPGTAFYNIDLTDEWIETFGEMKLAERFSLKIIYYSPTFDLLPRTPIESTGEVISA